jgi:DNA-3-methyladenine glycosylase I
MMVKSRCDWADSNDLMIQYHDTEWGVPLHDDRKLFEFLVLDTFQAGLSWSTILNKRDNFRRAFDDFDPVKISRYSRRKIESLLKDAGIIRNKLKIEAVIKNAAAFLEIQAQFGSFDKYIWQFVGHKAIVNKRRRLKDIPANTTESDAMSKDLKMRGFKFVG